MFKALFSRQVLDWMVLKGITIHRGAYNLAGRHYEDALKAVCLQGLDKIDHEWMRIES